MHVVRILLLCSFHLIVVRSEEVNATTVETVVPEKETIAGTATKTEDVRTSETCTTGNAAAITEELVEKKNKELVSQADEWSKKEGSSTEAKKGELNEIERGDKNSDHIKEEDEEQHDEETVKRVVINYASMEAGAQVLETSPTSKGFHNLLVDDKDKYGITECAEKKMVVIRLTDEIQATHVVLAQYEKYSSGVKEFKISGSRIYPTKDWVPIGNFTAAYGENEQTFSLPTSTYVRYLKLRFLSHYGDEYMCTVSQIKVHGKTMMENFELDLEQHDREVNQRLQAFDGDQLLINETELKEEEIDKEQIITPTTTMTSSNNQTEETSPQKEATVAIPSDMDDARDKEQKSANVSCNNTETNISLCTNISDNVGQEKKLLECGDQQIVKQSVHAQTAISIRHESNKEQSNNKDEDTIDTNLSEVSNASADSSDKANGSVPLKKLAIGVAGKLLEVVTATAFHRANASNATSINVTNTTSNANLSTNNLYYNEISQGAIKDQTTNTSNESSSNSTPQEFNLLNESRKANSSSLQTIPTKLSASTTTDPAPTQPIENQTATDTAPSADSEAKQAQQSCLRNLDYKLFKERMLLKSTQQAAPREVTTPPVPGYDSIFKTLMDKIKAFEINHSIAERYLVHLHACFVSSVDQIESKYDAKLQAIRDEIRLISARQDAVSEEYASIINPYDYRGPRLHHTSSRTASASQLLEDHQSDKDEQVKDDMSTFSALQLPQDPSLRMNFATINRLTNRIFQWTTAKLRELDDADQRPETSDFEIKEAPLEFPQFDEVLFLIVLLSLVVCLATLSTCTCFVFWRLETIRAMFLAQPKVHHHYYPAVIETHTKDSTVHNSPAAVQPLSWEAQPSSLRFRRRGGASQLVPQDDASEDPSSGSAPTATAGARIPMI
uniref:SUN domain-containing protein n=1 Tax=Aureoumbra lagunensis TaxID=44058 RepID=A0A7S3NMX8_9STRA|mmetsp:Transcript_19260/g.29223  ORF Transcript_19260/g.29223 Transcript_19260/m.29223 type:complete len:901 (+) Transcript_19260:68-2770(+)